MSILTRTRYCLLTALVFVLSTSDPGQIYKIWFTPLEAGPIQIENAMGARPDRRGGLLPLDQASAPGTRIMSRIYRATISPQPGPQTQFLQTSADICIYGGAAGSGKTIGLILEALRYVLWVPNFSAVFFRRTMPEITNPGALWDETLKLYPQVGGTPHIGAREWRWPGGGKITFSHLQFDVTVYHWQGAQITLICYDELTHFTAHQFFYMVSRNRSTCGVRPYIRATCNPDADSWVAEFLA